MRMFFCDTLTCFMGMTATWGIVNHKVDDGGLAVILAAAMAFFIWFCLPRRVTRTE